MYRPLRFDQVVGQKVALELIKNALYERKLPRAVILYGASGTGKTTIARLIASYFVCEKVENYDVCGKCAMCKSVQDGAVTDILEFDAASNTSVEDIRQILDQANYAPQYSKQKVFIIDEAHMLSRHAISAFLKVLEEAKDHVRFVMATTEIEKIPDAIRSRCLCIALHEIEKEEMKNYLVNLLEKHGVEWENEALDLLIHLSNGSMREALSIISQVLLLGKKIDSNLLESILAIANAEDLKQLANLIFHRDFVKVFELTTSLLEKNISALPLLRQLIYYICNLVEKNSDRKEEAIKVLIDLRRLFQDVSKIACFNEMISIGLAEIAYSF